ncbi:hypothetical protein OS493_036871 [Desmophyllum pertusum]|uniref:Uncharacterized protein n=1 Tax=Desmophyllum pertusum TaxID=174260 RepID=A0A9X0CU38_9CNID|nr:hypothetical protein OS493_036871 [Desmophyllum pertusum]
MEASASLARLRRAGEEVDLIVFKEKTTVMPIGNTPVVAESLHQPHQGNDKPTLYIYIIEEESPTVVWSSDAYEWVISGFHNDCTNGNPTIIGGRMQDKAGRSEAKME